MDSIATYLLWSDIAQAFWTVFLLIACGGILFAVRKLSTLIEKLESKIDPIASQSLKVLENVDDTLNSLKGKAESMLDTSEQAVKNVAAKVDTTSSLVEGAVAKPAIGVRSIMAGINRGLETWRHYEPGVGKNGTAVPQPHGTPLEEKIQESGA